jgi:hypothetical protein
MSEHRVDWSRQVTAQAARHIHRKNLRAFYLLGAVGLISLIFQLLLSLLGAR